MSGPVVRALPPRPDLEYERKQAKHLLRDIRRGDPGALSRVRAQNRSLGAAKPEGVKLADAQLAIAREYGFRSWPLLVRYFEMLDRHRRSNIHRNRGQDRTWYEGWPESYLREFRERRHSPAIMLGSFVPRFYGMKLEEIFAGDPTLDEMRLGVARHYGCASWDELMEAADMSAIDPWREADPAHRPVSPQRSLEQQLLGWLGMRMQPDRVAALLEQGADPTWVAPNGYTVLEHAIYRYWNGEAVDVLARRVKAPDTAFVAAGLGDAARLRRFFDRNGKLTARARRDRPDLMSLSGHGDMSLPDPEDELLLWELAFVASVNVRPTTFDVLLEHGFPIDYHFGMTLLSFAAGNALLPMVDLLVSRGASPHVRGYKPSITALEMAVSRFEQNPDDATLRRILELLGGDPDTVAREAEAKRKPPEPNAGLRRTLAFAMQDAARQGSAKLSPENFLVGLISGTNGSMELRFFADAGVDLARLRSRYADRIAQTSSNVVALSNDEELQRALDLASVEATQRRDAIATWSVAHFLLEPPDNSLAGIISDLGGDVQKVKESLKRLVP